MEETFRTLRRIHLATVVALVAGVYLAASARFTDYEAAIDELQRLMAAQSRVELRPLRAETRASPAYEAFREAIEAACAAAGVSIDETIFEDGGLAVVPIARVRPTTDTLQAWARFCSESDDGDAEALVADASGLAERLTAELEPFEGAELQEIAVIYTTGMVEHMPHDEHAAFPEAVREVLISAHLKTPDDFLETVRLAAPGRRIPLTPFNAWLAGELGVAEIGDLESDALPATAPFWAIVSDRTPSEAIAWLREAAARRDATERLDIVGVKVGGTLAFIAGPALAAALMAALVIHLSAARKQLDCCGPVEIAVWPPFPWLGLYRDVEARVLLALSLIALPALMLAALAVRLGQAPRVSLAAGAALAAVSTGLGAVAFARCRGLASTGREALATTPADAGG